jgi:hypothetical protein
VVPPDTSQRPCASWRLSVAWRPKYKLAAAGWRPGARADELDILAFEVAIRRRGLAAPVVMPCVRGALVVVEEDVVVKDELDEVDAWGCSRGSQQQSTAVDVPVLAAVGGRSWWRWVEVPVASRREESERIGFMGEKRNIMNNGSRHFYGGMSRK